MSRRNFPSVTVEINSFAKNGHGIGAVLDDHQRAVEVPFTIPGDKAKVQLLRKRHHIYSSHLEELISPSPLRITPRCVHFGICGGCRWQQMTYEEQLNIKQGHLEKLFKPLLSDSTKIYPVLPCTPPWHYRNKMEFSFSNDASGHQYLGLMMDGSRGKVLNLTECHLVNHWYIDGLKAVRAWWHESGLTAYHPHHDKGSLRTLTLREGMRTGDRMAMLTVSGNPDYALNRRQMESFTAYIRDAIEPLSSGSKLSVFLRIQQAVKGQETNFYEMHLEGSDHIREILYIQTDAYKDPIPLEFTVSPSAFFQPNTVQAERLYSNALQLLDIPANSIVYDLYCGTGTLGICAAKMAKSVVGIEISPESSLDARSNVAKNGLTNVDIVNGTVREAMDSIRKEQTFPMPDIVMVDPPRVGLDKDTLQHLSELKPLKILYISCNPATQAENIKILQQSGYHITAMQPVDQFPHTVHTENIVVLERA